MGRRFTFIELIVVIIIVVTILMLIPANISHTSERAQHTKCKANLKQIGAAVHIYYSDLNDKVKFPFAQESSIQEGGFFEIVPELLKCPAEGGGGYIWLADEIQFGAESVDEPLASDASEHKQFKENYTVFQDGHVE